MSGGDYQVQSRPQLQNTGAADSGYAFSSTSFRKKKKGSKKLRNKKIVTTAEASSKRGKKEISRSQSTSALPSGFTRKTQHESSPKANYQWNSKALLTSKVAPLVVTTPPAPAPVVKPAASVTSSATTPVSHSDGSPLVFKRKSKSREQEEYEEDLSSSGRHQKPWETDIQNKNKTEYGDRLLRDGPSSTDRISTSRSASHHLNFRRSRSLSTTRHRSLSRHRSVSRSNRSSRRLFSENHQSDEDPCSGEDDDANAEQNWTDEPPSSFDEDDHTYEKYRQFLASAKKKEDDEKISRQSVLSLKQKVGAAPALNFSYRYSAAADEILGLGKDDDYNDDGDTSITDHEESKSHTEDLDDPLALVDLVLRSEENSDKETVEFLSDVDDATNDRESGESRCEEQSSSPVVVQEASSPLPSPVPESPLHSPPLTPSTSPITNSPARTAPTEDERSPSPIQESQQQEQYDNDNDGKATQQSSLLLKEVSPHCEKESSLSSEKDRGNVNEDVDTRSMPQEEEEEDHQIYTGVTAVTDEHYGVNGDGFGVPELDTSHGQDDVQDCPDENELGQSDKTDVYAQEDVSCNIKNNHLRSDNHDACDNGYGDPRHCNKMQQDDVKVHSENNKPTISDEAEFQAPEDASYRDENHHQRLDFDDDYKDGYGETRVGSSQQREDAKATPDNDKPRTSAKTEVQAAEHTLYSDDNHHQPYDEEIDELCKAHHCEPIASPTLVQSEVPSLRSEESDSIQSRVGEENGGQDSGNKIVTGLSENHDDEIDEDFDKDFEEEFGEDSSYVEEDPDYPEEDRQYLTLLYGIHMS